MRGLLVANVFGSAQLKVGASTVRLMPANTDVGVGMLPAWGAPEPVDLTSDVGSALLKVLDGLAGVLSAGS